MNSIAITNTLTSEIILSGRMNFDFSWYPEKNIAQELSEFFQIKEQEWVKLVGKERWYALNEEKRVFLVKTAGAIDLGERINIREAYKYYE
jgi:hypothetical protein